MSVENGKQVSIEYTLTDSEENVIESNVGQDPLIYNHGTQQIIAGLEKGLEGLSEGDTRTVVVKPEEAYGTVMDEAFIEVPNSNVPEGARKIGTQLQTTNPDGQVMHARVSELKDESVVLDFNHPLAGKTLHFDVKVLEVSAAAE